MFFKGSLPPTPHPPLRSYANEHFAFIFVELDLWLGWNMEWRAHYLKRYRPLVRRSQMAVCWGVLPLVLGSHQQRQQSQSDLNCCPDCRGTVSNSGIFQESSQKCSIFTAYTATIYAQCQKIIGGYLYCFHNGRLSCGYLHLLADRWRAMQLGPILVCLHRGVLENM